MMPDLFKGFDLQIGIKLEKGKYDVPDTVRGSLMLSTEKGCSPRGIRFAAMGWEETRITVHGHGSMHSTRRTRTYSESSIFFTQNLLPFLKETSGISISTDELKIEAGSYNVPFEFVLSDDLPQSYIGRHAKVEYWVGIVVDRQHQLDVKGEALFAVVNRKKICNISSNSDIRAAFKPFGKTDDASLEFDQDSAYTSGQPVEGRVVILKDLGGKKVSGLEMMLRQVEYAEAQTRKSSDIMGEWKKKIEVGNDERAIPFSIQVPDNIHPTYIGKISKLIWVLEAKVNVSWSRDIHAATIIGIV